MAKGNGLLICLVGAAGSGKTSLGKRLLDQFSESLELSISATSRKPREGEVDGKDYHFYSDQEFEKMVDDGCFFEWEKTHGNYYGTVRSEIEGALSRGMSVLLDVDIRGSYSFRKSFVDSTVIIFLVPPSPEVLVERIRSRGSVTEEELEVRLETCKREYSSVLASVGEKDAPDYLVINDDFEKTAEQLASIVRVEKCKFERFSAEELGRLCKV